MVMKIFQKASINEIFRVTVLALAVGIAAGVIGAVLTENYLFRYMANLEDVSLPLRLSEEKPRPLPGTYEEAVENIRERVEPSLVRIYDKLGITGTIDKRVYDPDSALASGVIVTSDGWVVSSGELSDETLGGLVAVVGRQVYEITEFSEDAATGLVLFKIDGVNLPVVAFGPSEAVEEGDLAFVVPALGAMINTSVERVRDANGVIHDAEALLRHFVLQDSVSADAYAAPVTNSAGELVGFVVPDDDEGATALVRPLHHVLPAIESVLAHGEVARPYLGASVVDIVSTIGLSDADTRDHDQGALVTRDPAGRYASGVIPGSPADLAGLLNDDIILEVNDEIINLRHPLAEILLAYEPGDELRLEIDREGEKVEAVVILGQFE